MSGKGWIAGGRIRMAETNDAMRHDKRGVMIYFSHSRWRKYLGMSSMVKWVDIFLDWHLQMKKTGYACGERGFLLKTNGRR